MFGRIFNRNDPAPASTDESTLGRRDTLPANAPSTWDNVAARGNAAIDKATEIYNRNPKLVGGLALVAGALLLNRMRRGKGA